MKSHFLEDLNKFRKQWIREELSSVAMNKEVRGRYEVLLSAMVIKKRTRNASECISKESRKRFQRRKLNINGLIEPVWECFARKGDEVRTREDHAKAVDNLIKSYRHWRNHPNKPENNTIPEGPSLNALLNMLATINTSIPKVDFIIDSGPHSSYSRKVGSKFIRIGLRRH